VAAVSVTHHFEEPDKCGDCGSTAPMSEEDVSINGQDGWRAWLCPDCGCAHIKHPGKCAVYSCNHQAGGPAYADDDGRSFCPCCFASPAYPGGDPASCDGPMPADDGSTGTAGSIHRAQSKVCPKCGATSAGGLYCPNGCGKV